MRVLRVWCKGLALLWVLFLFQSVPGAEWPSYRGPNQDGSTSESVRTNWATKPLQVLWSTNLSPGLSSFSISGGKLFTLGKGPFPNQDTEYCIALSAVDGHEIWNAPIGPAYYPNGGVGDDDGPRSTPALDGNRVFALSSYLGLYCFSANFGQTLWHRELTNDFKSTIIGWQNAASPLVVDDLVLVNANAPSGGSIFAFNKTNGAVVWRGHNEGMTHSTPVLTTIGGTRQAIFFTQSGLLALDPLSGGLLWRYGLTYSGVSVAASPVVSGDTVYASRGYPSALSRAQAGAILLRVDGSGTNFSASKLWMKTNALMNHWATPVRYNGYIYGMFGHGLLKFQCADETDGSIKWSVDGLGYGSVILAKDRVIAVSETGRIQVVDPNPEVYTELARAQILEGKCWNTPILSDGVLYLRSTLGAVALDVSLPEPPPPKPWKMQIGRSGDGRFQLTLEKEDASTIDPSVTNKLNIYATSDLSLPAMSWTKLTDAPLFFDGQLHLDNPEGSATEPQRYYRMEEVP